MAKTWQDEVPSFLKRYIAWQFQGTSRGNATLLTTIARLEGLISFGEGWHSEVP